MINKIFQGDCIEVMKTLSANSVDTILTDPPYGISFMSKEWDDFSKSKLGNISTLDLGIKKESINFLEFNIAWATEALRVAKPGATAMVFSSSRTQHLMMLGLEIAGWVLKDSIMWCYLSGFPKAFDIGKGIQNQSTTKQGLEWQGYKSHCLKPAYEPIIMAVKPNNGNYIDNALKYGVSGLNIGGSRIPYKHGETPNLGGRAKHTRGEGWGFKAMEENIQPNVEGRFPSNVIIDDGIAEVLDKQTGITKSSGGRIGNKGSALNMMGTDYKKGDAGFGDIGGGSKSFFKASYTEDDIILYCPKPSNSEKNKGCDNLDKRQNKFGNQKNGEDLYNSSVNDKFTTKSKANYHPTAKPIKLCRYLNKLTKTPAGGIVLDPFTGSGSLLIGAMLESRGYIGIELNPDYIQIAEARLKGWDNKQNLII